MDRLERWAKDIEPVPAKWGTHDYYLEALEVGVSDVRTVANALAVVEEVARVSDALDIPFDAVADAALAALAGGTTLRVPPYRLRYARKRFRLVLTRTRFRLHNLLHRGVLRLSTRTEESR